MVRLENRRENKRKVHIGVVCASGIGISRLMVSKMNRQFLERAEITAYGTGDLNPFALDQLDFLVSTLPIKEDLETLSVSPLLTEEEMERIEKRVRFYERMPEKITEKNEFTRQLEQINYVAVQIKSLIQDMGYLLVSPDISFDELLVAVTEQLSPYYDRQLKIQEDLKRRKELGRQVFPDFGFALLHCKTAGVMKPRFSVCQTKEFAPYEQPYFERVGVIIVMLMPADDHQAENREILGFLSETLVEQPEFLATMAGGRKEEIQAVLSKNLKRFFNQYLDRV